VYLFAVAVCMGISGCTSTSGLLLRPGAHKQLRSAEVFAHKLPHELNAPRELEKQFGMEYRVEPGDVLAVEPADFNSPVRLPSDQTVLPDGYIELGRYGRLYAAGKTVEEIEAEVQPLVDRAHADDESAEEATTEISVRLLQPESKVYYVLGEVNSAGSFPLQGRETVLDAIVQAGGLSDRANRHRIILSRPTPAGSCRIVLPVCYKQIVQLGDTTTNYQIRPGDRIYVPSLTWCRELLQTLDPSSAEKCPKCVGPQVPCPDGDGCLMCTETMGTSPPGSPKS
jgi:polysaccharide export outer membrane protein